MDRKNVEALYPLTPMQQALLFHSLRSEGTAVDEGYLPLQMTLRGALNRASFEQAWEKTMARHDALRSSIHWQGVKQPLQMVLRQVDLVWHQVDWRGMDPDKQQAQLDQFLQEDRTRGLDLTKAPVMRLALFRLADDCWQFFWGCHHLLLDGWSGALVLQEVLAQYEALESDSPLAMGPPASFRTYASWVKAQDLAPVETYWRDLLGNLPVPQPLVAAPSQGTKEVAETYVVLSEAQTDQLTAWAKHAQVTLGTLLQGAWALTLRFFLEKDDLVWGTTVSGRSVPVPSIETMVGLLVNALPVRLQVAASMPVLELMQALTGQLAVSGRYAFSSPAQLHAWSGRAGHQRLFESLVVIENYPPAQEGSALKVENFKGGFTSNYPLTLAVLPGDCLDLHLLFRTSVYSSEAARHILQVLKEILLCVSADVAQTVADVMDATTKRHPRLSTGSSSAEEHLPQAARGHGEGGPRDPLEWQLLAIWEDVLGVRPLRVTDDFFEQGGHSLIAAQLFERIGEALGQPLPLALLFQHSTIAELAKVLRQEQETVSWSSVVPIKRGRVRRPLFCVHSYGGHVFFYRDLAHHLADDQPVYGLQAVGLDGAEPITDLAEAAAHYIREMRTVQSQGPYALMGYCLGNVIALEMAQQLYAHGEEVAPLFITDNGPPGHAPYLMEEEQSWAGRLLWRVRKAVFNRQKHRHINELASPERPAEQEEALVVTENPHWKRVEAALQVIGSGYAVHQYPGEVTLIQSEAFAQKPSKRWQVKRWEEVAAGLNFYVVAGSPHGKLLDEPYVAELGPLVQQVLDDEEGAAA